MGDKVHTSLEDVKERVKDVIEQHDQQPGVSGHGGVQTSLEEVVSQVQEAIELHKETDNPVPVKEGKDQPKSDRTVKIPLPAIPVKSDSVPVLLEDVAKQVNEIIKRHDDVPGLNGHDDVQASLQEVVEHVQNVIDVHNANDKETDKVHTSLEDVKERVKDVIEQHDQQPGVSGHDV